MVTAPALSQHVAHSLPTVFRHGSKSLAPPMSHLSQTTCALNKSKNSAAGMIRLCVYFKTWQHDSIWA